MSGHIINENTSMFFECDTPVTPIKRDPDWIDVKRQDYKPMFSLGTEEGDEGIIIGITTVMAGAIALVIGSLSSFLISDTASLIFGGVLFAILSLSVPALMLYDAIHAHQQSIDKWERSKDLYQILLEKRPHRISDDTKQYAMYAIEIVNPKAPTHYRLLQYRCAGTQYKVLKSIEIPEDAMSAAEMGAELAQTASALEEQARIAHENNIIYDEANALLEYENNRLQESEIKTRADIVRSAVGY